MPEESNRAGQNETDILTKFEADNLPEHYREYYANKRHNLFASIEGFPAIWKCFMLIDKIWLREFNNYDNVSVVEQMLPLLLFMNAHSKARISIELGFSTSVTEAFSILRDAIESVAFAHQMLQAPSLVEVWSRKDDGKEQEKKFRKAFIDNRRTQLFKGLDELYDSWKQFSDVGSHTTLRSLVQQFAIEESDNHIRWRFNYTGSQNERALADSLLVILLAIHRMEETLFKDFYSRLHLDTGLVDMRRQFENEKEACRKHIISRYKIPPPSITPQPPSS